MIKTQSRAFGARGKTFAVLLAGAIGFASVGGGAIERDAYAQTKKPAKPGTKAADVATAKAAYASGVQKFSAGDYAGALTDFQTADAVKQTPQAARYIGRCQDKLGHYNEALDAYGRFLADVPAKMQTEGDEIRGRVDEIKRLPGKVHVESLPIGATVLVDGIKQGGPTPTDIDVAPGSHTLRLVLDAYLAQDKPINVTFASKQDVSVKLEPVPPPPPPVVAQKPVTPPPAAEPPPPEKHSRAAAFITGGAAIAAVGVGTAFGIVSLHDKTNFDKNPTTDGANTGENHTLIADMCFAAAVTLGVTSIVLFVQDDPPAAATAASSAPVVKRSLTASPFVTPHGGGAGALLRF